uniref:Beta-1,4-N-acetyl-galactosaminyl transferase 1a n=1 Tax=Neolamprologus brichardi TaxID=32507 RepID=A0A3Q4HKX8_NEOBR
MHNSSRKCVRLALLSGILLVALFYFWKPNRKEVDISSSQVTPIKKLFTGKIGDATNGYKDIPYHIKEEMASRLAQNACVCKADEKTFRLPLSNLLFPHVWAHNLDQAFLEFHPDPESVKQHRADEYNNFRERSYNPADVLNVADANSPLQYPTQGVLVRPLKTIIIPGKGIFNMQKNIETHFDVAAQVDMVSIQGVGEKNMVLSSPLLSALNKQLQFVTYTNTVFHPKTADTIQFATKDHQSFFTIKIEHRNNPKLYNSGYQKEYNITALVTIATKTFLRYDKLKDLIDSIREYYPTVTIVIADDNEHPQPVTGPHIEHYIMPFGKVNKLLFLYVMTWSLFQEARLVKNSEFVGGAVREATGYTATYRHTISVEDGGKEGDCLHIRLGYHHDIKEFPNCVVADAVINFFMARTVKVQQVGFDPRLARQAHLEFFIDALGHLHIGSCSDVIVSHASKIILPWSKTDVQKAYEKFRYSSSATNAKTHNEVFYFKNRFKCMTSQ